LLASEAEEAGPRLSSNTANLAKAIATIDQEIVAAQEAMGSARMLAATLYGPKAVRWKRRPTRLCVNQRRRHDSSGQGDIAVDAGGRSERQS
jgi:hypothetical protein